MDPLEITAPPTQDLQVRTRRRGDTLWIELCGEIDLSNHLDLTRSLSSVNLDQGETLGLDLTKLTFCDARGLCHLLDMAEQARLKGRDVVARHATTTFRRMTGILGYEVLVRFE